MTDHGVSKSVPHVGLSTKELSAINRAIKREEDRLYTSMSEDTRKMTIAQFLVTEYKRLSGYVRRLIDDAAARDGEDIVQDVAYWQAFGILFLGRLLSGGFGHHHGSHHPRKGLPHNHDEHWKEYKRLWQEKGDTAAENLIERARKEKNAERT